MSFRNIRRTFPEYLPVLRSVDRFPVDLQPFSDVKQDLRILFGDGSVRSGAHIQQKRTVLADNIHQIAENILRRPELVIFGITPGIQSNSGIRLPEVRLHIRKLPPFHIRHCRSKQKGIVFVIDHRVRSPLVGPVVIVGGKLLQPGLAGAVLNPPVKIEYLRTVAVDYLAGAHQPVL